jgi:FkbM family methyltransferase
MFGNVIKYERRERHDRGHIGSYKTALNADQIQFCYEVILGRAADEGGLVHYVRVAKAQSLNTLHLLACELYRSDEFQSRFCAGQLDVFAKTKEIEYHGLRFELPENDSIFKEIAASGSYEPYVSHHLFSHIQPGDVFVDVGANLGALSLPVAKLVGTHGRVLAFEASQRNANLLMKNAIVNKLGNVEVFPLGLSDRNGAVISHVSLGTSNKSLIDLPSSQLQNRMEVIPVVRLDDFFARDCKVSTIKIDVEGFEYKVIRGALETISKWRPKLYLEYSDAFQRSGSGVPGACLLELLVDLEYTPTVLHRDRPPEGIKGDKNSIVVALNNTWEQCVSQGGTHVDLYWESKTIG